jgi:hypothetical protein
MTTFGGAKTPPKKSKLSRGIYLEKRFSDVLLHFFETLSICGHGHVTRL